MTKEIKLTLYSSTQFFLDEYTWLTSLSQLIWYYSILLTIQAPLSLVWKQTIHCRLHLSPSSPRRTMCMWTLVPHMSILTALEYSTSKNLYLPLMTSSHNWWAIDLVVILTSIHVLQRPPLLPHPAPQNAQLLYSVHKGCVAKSKVHTSCMLYFVQALFWQQVQVWHCLWWWLQQYKTSFSAIQFIVNRQWTLYV